MAKCKSFEALEDLEDKELLKKELSKNKKLYVLAGVVGVSLGAVIAGCLASTFYFIMGLVSLPALKDEQEDLKKQLNDATNKIKSFKNIKSNESNYGRSMSLL